MKANIFVLLHFLIYCKNLYYVMKQKWIENYPILKSIIKVDGNRRIRGIIVDS